jgi:hypothetical protein
MAMDEQLAITQILDQMIREDFPDVTFHPKYGGTVCRRPCDPPTSQFCGFFVYQNHVALVLSFGARLPDPDRQLEGGGKLRRQIALRHVSDIEDKNCRHFLRLAYGLARD